jgi:uncharacterized OsmC-like protein
MLTIMGISARDHGFSFEGTRAVITKKMESNPRRISGVDIELHFPDISYSSKHKKILEIISKTCPVALSLHPELKQSIQLFFKD